MIALLLFQDLLAIIVLVMMESLGGRPNRYRGRTFFAHCWRCRCSL